jgi:hypothetical protein
MDLLRLCQVFSKPFAASTTLNLLVLLIPAQCSSPKLHLIFLEWGKNIHEKLSTRDVKIIVFHNHIGRVRWLQGEGKGNDYNFSFLMNISFI